MIGLCRMLLTHIASLCEQIGLLERDLRARARQDETAKRLMTIPGIGVICATALEALAPTAESFGRGRDFAAWLGLTPRQKSSGGKTRLGATSRMGQRDLRRLLICGAVAVVGFAQRSTGGLLARTHGGEEATALDGRSLGKQNSTHRLGSYGPRWRLQGSGRGRRVRRRLIPEASGM